MRKRGLKRVLCPDDHLVPEKQRGTGRRGLHSNDLSSVSWTTEHHRDSQGAFSRCRVQHTENSREHLSFDSLFQTIDAYMWEWNSWKCRAVGLLTLDHHVTLGHCIVKHLWLAQHWAQGLLRPGPGSEGQSWECSLEHAASGNLQQESLHNPFVGFSLLDVFSSHECEISFFYKDADDMAAKILPWI